MQPKKPETPTLKVKLSLKRERLRELSSTDDLSLLDSVVGGTGEGCWITIRFPEV